MASLLLLSLLSLTLALFARTNGFQVDLTRIESRRTRLTKEGKFDVIRYHQKRLQEARLASSSQPLNDYNDIEYTANVSIGTPPQHFIVLLDIETYSFWVPDKTCATKACPSYCKDAVYCKSLCDPRCCTGKKQAIATTGKPLVQGDCGWRNRFDSSKSRTYRNNGTHFRSILAVDEGEGFIGVDTVTLGDNNGLVIPSQTFGQATTGLFTSNDAFDGVLGIGSSYEKHPGMVPLLVNAKQQGLVKNNMFTVALRRDGDASPNLPGGTITYGDLDTNNCGAVKAYIPSRSGPAYLQLDALSFGGFQSTKPAGSTWEAVFSFSSTALSAPKNISDAIAKSVGATAGDYKYNIDCNATIPSLLLTLSGVQVEIPASELIEVPYNGAKMCRLNIYPDAYSTYFIIGAGLTRKNCLIFDMDNKRLGVAPNLYAR